MATDVVTMRAEVRNHGEPQRAWRLIEEAGNSDAGDPVYCPSMYENAGCPYAGKGSGSARKAVVGGRDDNERLGQREIRKNLPGISERSQRAIVVF